MAQLVERVVWDHQAAGSNPVTPTIYIKSELSKFGCFGLRPTNLGIHKVFKYQNRGFDRKSRNRKVGYFAVFLLEATMKCQVCGAESGKYPLCRVCNIKKEQGDIFKCHSCGRWHYVNQLCTASISHSDDQSYLYEKKQSLISKSEQAFFAAIKESLPPDYYVFPQINLASFIEKNDNSRYHNELFRNVDFLITSSTYNPLVVIEINDMTHMDAERKERDIKVGKIFDEAGVKRITFWTSYGVNNTYIKEKIAEAISSPVNRIHHFSKNQPVGDTNTIPDGIRKKRGCYIATCVYKSYDCAEVWTLRRFRDNTLSQIWYGRFFIRIYYAVSPILVKWFGKAKWFEIFWKRILNKLVKELQSRGLSSEPYIDPN